MKTIHIDLFRPSSVDAAIQELQDYSKRVQRKADELRDRVAQFIVDQAAPVFASAIADDTFRVINGKGDKGTPEGAVIGGVDVKVESRGDHTTLVIANGEDAVFMEFGAGVYHNGSVGSSPNPWGADLGFTIGSYGKGNGRKAVWGFRGSDGKIHLTHGVPASMPLFRAVTSVSENIVRIAREVFNSD